MSMWLTSEGLLGHDIVKVLTAYFSSIRRSPLQHFLQLLNAHSFTKFFGHPLYVGHVDATTLVIVKQLKYFVDSVLNRSILTLLSLSPSFDVIASRNSSKSISRPSASNSVIMLKIVGFFASNPRLCMADFSSLGHKYRYLGSIFPVASVSKRLKASLSSSI